MNIALLAEVSAERVIMSRETCCCRRYSTQHERERRELERRDRIVLEKGK